MDDRNEGLGKHRITVLSGFSQPNPLYGWEVEAQLLGSSRESKWRPETVSFGLCPWLWAWTQGLGLGQCRAGDRSRPRTSPELGPHLVKPQRQRGREGHGLFPGAQTRIRQTWFLKGLSFPTRQTGMGFLSRVFLGRPAARATAEFRQLQWIPFPGFSFPVCNQTQLRSEGF